MIMWKCMTHSHQNSWEQVCLEFRFLRNVIHTSTLFNTTIMTHNKINSCLYSKTTNIHGKRDPDQELQTAFYQLVSLSPPKCQFQEHFELGLRTSCCRPVLKNLTWFRVNGLNSCPLGVTNLVISGHWQDLLNLVPSVFLLP